jgi:hypothetical protein
MLHSRVPLALIGGFPTATIPVLGVIIVIYLCRRYGASEICRELAKRSSGPQAGIWKTLGVIATLLELLPAAARPNGGMPSSLNNEIEARLVREREQRADEWLRRHDERLQRHDDNL